MPASNSKKSPSLKALQTKLKSHLVIFDNICTFVDSLTLTTSTIQVSVRLEKLDDLWEKVNDAIMDIELHEEFSAEDNTYTKERSRFVERYYEVKTVLLEKMKELEEVPAANTSTRGLDSSLQPTVEHVRLPQIKLQSFDGNIDEWLSFRDLYTSLIHWKQDLPEVEKFHYLKGCLEGEAKALIAPLAITRANYQIAWDTLTKR